MRGTFLGPLFSARFQVFKSTMLLVPELQKAAQKAGVQLTHEQLVETARVVRHGLGYNNEHLGFSIELDG